MGARRAEWLSWLNVPTDARGLAVFRALFGALMLFSVVRFGANGWIAPLYTAPNFHFTYLGFDWVRPWPGAGMYWHFALMGLAALGVCLGIWTRLSCGLFFLTFTYVELLEKAAYLNHYYLVSLVALLLCVVPAGRCGSLDAWRVRRAHGEAPEPASVGRWAYLVLRIQVALVYVFAGLAKLDADWLWRAEPLRTWLGGFGDVPLVGGWLTAPWMAFAMAWFGALYDLTIVAWLCYRPTRAYAYVVALAFHISIWLLFPVGVFSWMMLVAATLFFDPAWPSRWWRTPKARPEAKEAAGKRLGHAGVLLLTLFVVLQCLIPLRFALYPGRVNWTEQGFRFAWRVMLIEKTGQVEYEVRTADGKRYHVYPRKELGALQYRMLCTQPDMIHQYALHLAQRFQTRSAGPVRVYAEAFAALNGRPSQRLVDPSVDLAAQPRSLAAQWWLLPLAE